MPRLVRIPECAYELFESIRAVILEHAPFALLNDIYHRGTAYFLFFDSDYIPFHLEPYVVAPPFDKVAMDKDMCALGGIFEMEPHKSMQDGFILLIQKWRDNAERAYSEGENNVGTTILEFLADLGDEDAKKTLAGFSPKPPAPYLESDFASIPMVATQEELEAYIADLPPATQEQLRQAWKQRKEAQK